ncbi:MAG: hypothetical protein H7X92_08095 [Chitinophagales bacterium]|nr:hypothetical protein [Hyphomicrobiales bacterium]
MFKVTQLVGIILLAASPATAQVNISKPKAKPAKIAVTDCQTVAAVAAYFGEEKTRSYAEGNLDNALDQAKSRLTASGKVGLVVKDRKVTCKNYIDFGGAIGQEQKCVAQAQLCLRAR